MAPNRRNNGGRYRQQAKHAPSGVPLTGIVGGSARHMSGARSTINPRLIVAAIAVVALAAFLAIARPFGCSEAQPASDEAVPSKAAVPASAVSSSSAVPVKRDFTVAIEGGTKPLADSSDTWKGISGITAPDDWTEAGYNPHDVLSVEAEEGIAYFDLRTRKQAAVSSNAMDGVRDAIAAIEEEGATCGFVVIELDSGRGVAYNPGQSTYSASCIKAPVVFYFLAQASQAGDSVYGNELVEYRDTLLYSDNDAYIELVDTHDVEACHAWLAESGITFPTDTDTSGFITDYFTYVSAAGLASAWAEMSATMDSSDADLALFWDDVAQAETSFIGDGLSGTGAKVWNKAGWIGDDDLSSVDDAGIVEVGGKRYVFAIATSEPAGESEGNVVGLVRALGDAFGMTAAADSTTAGDRQASSRASDDSSEAAPSSADAAQADAVESGEL